MSVRAGFSSRELSTVIAALRYWQQGKCCDLEIQELAASAGPGERCLPLDGSEIDDLCERLNFGQIAPVGASGGLGSFIHPTP